MSENGFRIIKRKSFGEIGVNRRRDILLVKYKEGIFINKQLAMDVVEAAYPVLQEFNIHFTIFDNTAQYISSTFEGRYHLNNNKCIDQLKAHAIIIDDLTVRLLINSFIKINKSTIPIKSFESYKEAINWLYTF